MRAMSDPTYNKTEINGREEWSLAFKISEHLNDNAPLGWSRYIPVAVAILRETRQMTTPEAIALLEREHVPDKCLYCSAADSGGDPCPTRQLLDKNERLRKQHEGYELESTRLLTEANDLRERLRQSEERADREVKAAAHATRCWEQAMAERNGIISRLRQSEERAKTARNAVYTAERIVFDTMSNAQKLRWDEIEQNLKIAGNDYLLPALEALRADAPPAPELPLGHEFKPRGHYGPESGCLTCGQPAAAHHKPLLDQQVLAQQELQRIANAVDRLASRHAR